MIPVGKIPYDLLSSLFEGLPCDPRTIVGPGIGEDAAVVDLGDRCLIVASDPITFATELIGWYVVQVNANDIACMGGEPKWFVATLLLPENQTDEALVRTIFKQMVDACREVGVSLIGGHTEVTAELTRPIAIGTMIGEGDKDSLVTSSGARPGDLVILTKGFPIEGTAIIAREKERELKGAGIDGQTIEKARDFLFRPGIGVVRDAHIACRVAIVHALHDPTEGGIANGLWELAIASSVRIIVDDQDLTPLPEGDRLCRIMGLNPLGTIASGALLICSAPSESQKILQALNHEGIVARTIGHVEGKSRPQVLIRKTDGTVEPLPLFQRDEIARLFE